jgi:hypothetical protein
MIYWAIAFVEECMHSRKDLQEVRVKLENGEQAKAYHYTDVLPPVVKGDQVLLNTTAVELSLGTGGYHFIYSILSKNNEYCEINHQHPGHMMKLRYTPQQRSVLAAEEEVSPFHSIFKKPRSIQGMTTLIGELHSMLPIVVCWLKNRSVEEKQHNPKIVYILSDGGALPMALSSHVSILNDLGWLAGTITYGQAYGGNIETLNKYTALIAAKHIFNADIAVIVMGPGIAGTGTMLGHSGVEVGEIVNAVSILEGIPVIIPRISFAERRQRHQGLSHHTLSSLSTIALKPAIVPLPGTISESEKFVLLQQIKRSDLDQRHQVHWVSVEMDEIIQSLLPYPQEITTMGRRISEDPVFFQGVCSAAQLAWNYFSDSLQ